MNMPRHVELIPLSPKIPINSKLLKLKISRSIKNKELKPQDKVSFHGYNFLVNRVNFIAKPAFDDEIFFVKPSRRIRYS
ncbi:MAG: hypothetical protein ACTSVI_01205 [Promethearchaeota archaeon]